MDEKTRKIYCDLLVKKLISMFAMSYQDAVIAVESSAIQQLIDEDPKYVDHVPLSSWAEDVYKEYICNLNNN